VTDARRTIGLATAILALAALALYLMGRTPICTCGAVKLWHGVVQSSENSQHLSDWYTFSHMIHGFAFYGLLWLAARMTGWAWRLGPAFLAALFIEAGWEVFENTDFVINRYREATISLDYYGDSIINSLADILAMALGFFLAAWLPVWTLIALVVATELFTLAMIRDNFTLNVIMLVWPLEAVLDWQNGS
jgi:hypothetical protein